MKTLISCILLLSSFLAPAMAQRLYGDVKAMTLMDYYSELTYYTRMVELVNEDSLKSAYIEKTNILVQEKMPDQNLNDSILSRITSAILIHKYESNQEFKQRTRDLRPYIDQYMEGFDVLSLAKVLRNVSKSNLGIGFDYNISDEEQVQIGNDIKNIVMKYMSGEECSEPKATKCPKDFWEAFMQRYDNVLKPYITEAIDGVRKSVGNLKRRQDAVDKAQEYMIANYHEILLSSYVKKYTLDDIRIMNNVAFGGETKKALKVAEAVVADRKGFADKCIESHIAYVKNLYVYHNPEDGSITIRDEHKDVQEAESQKEGKDNEPFFEVVEEMPSFPGGMAALLDFLSSNVKYPLVAEQNRIQGRVLVNFIVETDGSISEVKIRKGVDPSLDKEAIRVVRSMPKWNPGKQKGKPVRVLFFVPIVFSLQ